MGENLVLALQHAGVWIQLLVCFPQPEVMLLRLS